MIALLFCLATLPPSPVPVRFDRLPLRFDHLPLGSAARVLSARYHVPITLLAKATAPITGDFSRLDRSQTLAAIAQLAGLTVHPQGAGFVLGPASAFIVPVVPAPPPPVVSPEQRRAILLRRRAELFAEINAGG